MPNVFNLIRTARDTDDRLQLRAQALLSDRKGQHRRKIVVNPAQTYQRILGFGGAFTEAAAYVWHQLPEPRQTQVMRAYFDADFGHAYSLCRTHINSCDFSLGNYAYDEVPGDIELAHFTIARDRDHLLPMIKNALALSEEPLKIMATPWSPPAWMKTNGEMNHGGKLKPDCRDTWAEYFIRYIKAYAAEGVPIWGVSVQNEPLAVQTWDSCIYTAQEERDFVRDYLGPAFERHAMEDIKIIVWDHNRDLVFKRADTILGDPAAAKYVWGVGFHWYEKPLRFRNLSRVHEKYPETNLVFTEGCQEGGPHLGEWNLGERYAYHMINDLNHWAVGWIDWNMLLDERGGPNHVGNYCSAQIIADTRTGELHYQSSYYYFGHIARYVRPGAVRVGCDVRDRQLAACAFRNADGSLVVVILNRTEQSRDFSLEVGDQSLDVECPARSILTLAEAGASTR